MNLERVTAADAAELLAIYAPYVRDTAISFEYEVPTVTEFRDRILSISETHPYIKAVENGKILGYAYASRFRIRKAYDWSIETSIYIASSSRHQGIGRILYNALEQSLKEIGVLNMNACIAAPRGAEDPHLTWDSVHFHEAMGFTPVGTFHNSGYKFSTWYDMIWMEKMIGEHSSDPAPVRFGAWQ